MADDNAAANLLRQARATLVRQRQQLDVAIQQVDGALATLDASGTIGMGVIGMSAGTSLAIGSFVSSGADALARASTVSAPVRQHPVETEPARKVPTVREGILQVLADAGRPMKTMSIIQGVAELGIIANDDSVRSILVKLHKQDAVSRVGHGVYKLPDPETAEAPVSAGASDVSAPERKEVTDNGTTDVDPQDSAWKADDPDGRSGAPVGRGQGLVAL